MSQMNHLRTGNSSHLGDDMDEPLAGIRARYSEPNIATQLVHIQAANVPQQKSLDFLERLDCLYFTDLLRRDESQSST
ncbi:hypothetical protein FOMG_09824 [Fusarium oxysporum f. sp. melonis 26406]|uniref:Uncharacterized protein n=1 Tax=Fusarium oxysporum f. sp. melonis 26406 TaxID=1089452 RepID=W9ZZ35_FUSOX|nr:hypothetical protein FOMG_09824 [Fusarium oxysporum f. sp. melonis 26406]